MLGQDHGLKTTSKTLAVSLAALRRRIVGVAQVW
jgi:hypothetical protein